MIKLIDQEKSLSYIKVPYMGKYYLTTLFFVTSKVILGRNILREIKIVAS